MARRIKNRIGLLSFICGTDKKNAPDGLLRMVRFVSINIVFCYAEGCAESGSPQLSLSFKYHYQTLTAPAYWFIL